MNSGMSMPVGQALHAGRVEAEIAAVGLDEGLVALERRMQVAEIGDVVLRRQAAGGDVGNPVDRHATPLRARPPAGAPALFDHLDKFQSGRQGATRSVTRTRSGIHSDTCSSVRTIGVDDAHETDRFFSFWSLLAAARRDAGDGRRALPRRRGELRVGVAVGHRAFALSLQRRLHDASARCSAAATAASSPTASADPLRGVGLHARHQRKTLPDNKNAARLQLSRHALPGADLAACARCTIAAISTAATACACDVCIMLFGKHCYNARMMVTARR